MHPYHYSLASPASRAGSSCSFAKLMKDAGLIIQKGNKFNLKPPGRVDFVFTCVPPFAAQLRSLPCGLRLNWFPFERHTSRV